MRILVTPLFWNQSARLGIVATYRRGDQHLLLPVFLSLVLHGLVLTLQFDQAGLGLPSSIFNRELRRGMEPAIRIRLAPSTLPSVNEPLIAEVAGDRSPHSHQDTGGPKAGTQFSVIPAPPTDVAAPQEASRLEEQKQGIKKLGTLKQEALRQDADRQEQARQVALQQEAARLASATLESERRAAQQEVSRLEAQNQALEKQETKRQEALRQEADRQDQGHQLALQQEAVRLASAKLESDRRAAQQEASRLEAQKQALEKQETQRQEALRQEAERQEQARQVALKQEEARLASAKLESERRAAQQEASRLEAQKQALEQQETQRQEALRQEAERQEQARQVALQQEAARLAGAKLESERRAAQQEASRLEAQKQALEKQEAQRPIPPQESNRRRTLIGRPDRDDRLATYAEVWSRWVQQTADYEALSAVKSVPYTNPIVAVTLRADGTLEGIEFKRSSGVPEIDEAIRKLIISLAPFKRLPAEIANDYDLVEVSRMWTFSSGLRLLKVGR